MQRADGWLLSTYVARSQCATPASARKLRQQGRQERNLIDAVLHVIPFTLPVLSKHLILG